MRMLHLLMILFTLPGVFTQNWAVFYPPSRVCAVRGFDAPIPCIYSYPQGNKVVQMLWCSMKNNYDLCENPPYVYDSNSTTNSHFVYAGDDKSDCTLLIRNVQSSYSGEYRFRFITQLGGKWTGVPGVTLEVTDLKMSLIRISGTGTIKQGDSLNLTCDMNCTNSSSEFVWSKNNENLKQSGSVFHFPNVTVEDSGNYTCTWKSNNNSGSDSIIINVEAVPDSPVWITIVVVVIVLVVGLILIGLVVAAVMYRKKRVQTEQQKNDSPVYVNFRS